VVHIKKLGLDDNKKQPSFVSLDENNFPEIVAPAYNTFNYRLLTNLTILFSQVAKKERYYIV
jgi:hypothetical protein